MSNNWMRETERHVIQIVQSRFGASGKILDDSATGDPDFRIHYSDCRRAVGEVVSDPDPKMSALVAEVCKRAPYQRLELSPGSGVWHVKLTVNTNVKNLLLELPRIIEMLTGSDVAKWDGRYLGWHDPDVTDKELHKSLTSLKVSYIQPFPLEGDYAHLSFPSPRVGIAGTDSVVKWVEFVLSENPDVIAKLLGVQGVDERHVLLIAGDASPVTMDGPDGWNVPTQVPDLPAEITHVWTVSRFMWRHSLLWVRDVGWEVVAALRPDDPDRPAV